MAAHERFSPPEPQHLRTVRRWVAAAWIFGGALYFYFHITRLLIQENASAIESIGGRLRELLTIG